jgi:hypothetical protein
LQNVLAFGQFLHDVVVVGDVKVHVPLELAREHPAEDAQFHPFVLRLAHVLQRGPKPR